MIELQIVQTLALVAIAFLLATRRLVGPPGRDGEHGEPGLPGRDGEGGRDGENGRDGRDATDVANHQPGMVRLFHGGIPIHTVPVGSKHHLEALRGEHGMSVEGQDNGNS